METHKRTFAKTVTFRIVATFTTMLIVFLFTGEWLLSVGIGVVEFIAKLFIYYLHERAWEHVDWGRK
jgi:uncharacterized membrane protein